MEKISEAIKLILEKTIDVLEESKQDIFSIAESTRKEYDNVEAELNLINEEINEIIDKQDELEKANRKARLRLMEVSKHFNRYNEDDIRKAYKRAEDSSVEIAVLKEKEEQIKERRRELEERLRNLKKNVEKAEELVSRVGVIKDYLLSEVKDLNEHFDDLRQKHNLAIQIIQAQEEERRRLAREMHDGPAQSIANLVFRVEFAQQLLSKDTDKAREELEELKKLIRQGLQEVRRIIYDLRPMSLDDLGLVPTLKRYINKFSKETNLDIDFNVMGPEQRLPRSYEVTIFRLIQEGLNNIKKHAKANFGKVRLEFGKKRVNLLISDDGIGFERSQVEEGKYGLISMEERCNLLGGECNIESKPGKGVVIKIMLPIKKEVKE